MAGEECALGGHTSQVSPATEGPNRSLPATNTTCTVARSSEGSIDLQESESVSDKATDSQAQEIERLMEASAQFCGSHEKGKGEHMSVEEKDSEGDSVMGEAHDCASHSAPGEEKRNEEEKPKREPKKENPLDNPSE